MVASDSAPVASLPNLGDKSARLLRQAGIVTIGELREVGPVETYRRLLALGERPSLVLLWAMVAGLRGEHWLQVNNHEKVQLKAQLRGTPEDPRPAEVQAM
ncbi:TfoX/Sxy family protein (plasmid) [Deinococcus taeanensis]|uniref:TfoX/Sxy family protein n=1 Tax=Deinococcus taeanensis TaxID=2737050 RepID=UPI001CDC9039|nr:TfoX/Sxy family protein [Deinococcus taeanensis]UBV44539.1 TfoX/Sxy family protein [Deinococcus taeanensis]